MPGYPCKGLSGKNTMSNTILELAHRLTQAVNRLCWRLVRGVTAHLRSQGTGDNPG
jgi:hypothetical protein